MFTNVLIFTYLTEFFCLVSKSNNFIALISYSRQYRIRPKCPSALHLYVGLHSRMRFSSPVVTRRPMVWPKFNVKSNGSLRFASQNRMSTCLNSILIISLHSDNSRWTLVIFWHSVTSKTFIFSAPSDFRMTIVLRSPTKPKPSGFSAEHRTLITFIILTVNSDYLKITQQFLLYCTGNFLSHHK